MIHHPEFVMASFKLGPLVGYWYTILGIIGFMTSFLVVRTLGARESRAPSRFERYEILVVYISIAILVMLCNGDLAFPEVLLTLTLWAMILAWSKHLPVLRIFDSLALSMPAGLLIGRVGNFLTGTFYGRVTDVPWAIIFETDPARLPRHPSQLYEAALEGLLLYFALQVAQGRLKARSALKPGVLASYFLIGYGLVRFFVGFVREPDPQYGFVLGPFTLGQVISLGLIVLGFLAYFMLRGGLAGVAGRTDASPKNPPGPRPATRQLPEILVPAASRA